MEQLLPGHYKGEELNIVSAFEALGQKICGNLSEDDYQGIIKHTCPGAGACGGMYTANTMASAIEALGMSLPYSSSNPAVSPEKKQECLDAGQYIKVLLEKDIKPSDNYDEKSIRECDSLNHYIRWKYKCGVAFYRNGKSNRCRNYAG